MQNLKEAKLLAEKLFDYKEKGVKSALLTVVKVRGSSFRKEGAKFLVSEEGEEVCSISGGCLEKGLKEDALEVIKTGVPKLERINMEDESSWGMWLGCPGEVDIYIEPFKYDHVNNKWLELMAEGRKFVFVKKLFSDEKLLLTDEGKFITGKLDMYEEEAETLLNSKDPFPYLREDVFFDTALHYPLLILAGSSEELCFLKEFAETIGFKVRMHLPNEKFSIPDGSVVVIASHHLKADRSLLKRALESRARYIGIISSFKRFLRVSEELPVDDRVFCPAGLDIGNLTSEEVALSVISEIMKVYRNKSGLSLREIKKKKVNNSSSMANRTDRLMLK